MDTNPSSSFLLSVPHNSIIPHLSKLPPTSDNLDVQVQASSIEITPSETRLPPVDRRNTNKQATSSKLRKNAKPLKIRKRQERKGNEEKEQEKPQTRVQEATSGRHGPLSLFL